jgi:hypothetical protein
VWASPVPFPEPQRKDGGPGVEPEMRLQAGPCPFGVVMSHPKGKDAPPVLLNGYARSGVPTADALA